MPPSPSSSANPHRLTREQMHEIIDRGESILFPNGRIVTAKHELPSEAEIALQSGDTARADAALADIDRQIGDLAQQRARLAEQRRAEQAETARQAEATRRQAAVIERETGGADQALPADEDRAREAPAPDKAATRVVAASRDVAAPDPAERGGARPGPKPNR